MPHGNKKSKGKHKNRTKQQQPRTNNNASSSTSSTAGGTTNRTSSVGSSAPEPLNFAKNYKSAYTRYKEATDRFTKALRAKVPKDLLANGSANSLMDAVDYLAGSDVAIEKEMMRDLKIALVMRRKVSDNYGEHGDRGHEHFITILTYCWATLRAKQKKQQPSSARRTKPQQTQMDDLNRFENLMIEDAIGDLDEDAWDNLVRVAPPKPVVPDRLTLSELFRGTDRIAAIFFVMTLDDLMRYNADQYSKLKDSYRYGKRQGFPPLTIIEQVMEAATAANFSIQTVSTLEHQFALDFPHMNTIYRVFSVLVLPELAMSLTKVVTDHSPLASKFEEKHAFEFLGDAMECAFRSKADVNNRSAVLPKMFANKWKVPLGKVAELFHGVSMAVQCEAPNRQELNHISVLSGLAPAGMMRPPHTWLPKSKFIGQGRSITSTMRLLQGIGSVIHNSNGAPIVLKEGFFGKQWEDGKKLNNIALEMDEFLMGDVLPLLYTMCTNNFIRYELPFERELLTFFNEFKRFIKNPIEPVSWSLIFAVQTLLTSVFEVQGEVSSIGAEAKTSFNQFLDQIDRCVSLVSPNVAKPKIWYPNLITLRRLRHLARPMYNNLTTPRQEVRQERHGLWNPLCAGSFLLYIAYFGNLEAGLAMVDSFAQLRMVLHLYNALRRHEALMPGQIELLDWLYEAFKDNKAVWEGPLPNKGQFVQRWCIVYGTKLEFAKRRSEETKRSIQAPFGAQSSRRTNSARMGDETRQMKAITPKYVSKSFRRICLHDFTGVEDKYHTPEQRLEEGDTDFYRHAVRTNDTLAAMEADERLLACNLTSLGEILDQFIVKLFQVLELENMVQEILLQVPESVRTDRRADGRRATRWETSDDNLERQTMVHLFAEMLLGPLDFHPRPYEISIVARSAAFMMVYFQNMDPGQVMYFIPTQIVD